MIASWWNVDPWVGFERDHHEKLASIVRVVKPNHYFKVFWNNNKTKKKKKKKQQKKKKDVYKDREIKYIYIHIIYRILD